MYFYKISYPYMNTIATLICIFYNDLQLSPLFEICDINFLGAELVTIRVKMQWGIWGWALAAGN